METPQFASDALSANSLAERVLSATGMVEAFWDSRTDCLLVSSRLAALTGFDEGAVPAVRGLALAPFLPAADRDEARLAIRRVAAERCKCNLEFQFARPGGGLQKRFEATLAPVEDAFGQLVGIAGLLRELPNSVEAVSELTAWPAALPPSDAAVEHDHRVKNLLSAIQSLATLSARYSASMEECLSAFSSRVDALAAAHSLLTAKGWRGAELSEVVEMILGRLPEGRAAWGGVSVQVSPKAINALALALHELTHHALLHGALSLASGRIDVRWRDTTGGGFEIEWLETGGRAATESSFGFGKTLFERVTAREIQGEAAVSFASNGVRALLRAGVSSRMRPVNAAESPASAEDEVDGESSGGSGPADIRGVRILLVEDAVLLALELETGLVAAGAEVVGIASTLQEAEALMGLEFDAAVLDTNLNGDSVAPIAAALLARGIPFIFATGYRESAGIIGAFEAPVVRKPYNVHQIAAAIRAARQT